MSQPDPNAEANALRNAQISEYGQYVAVSTIYVGSARAFSIGDPVPASHVERGVVALDQVAKSTTKAAAAAVTEKG